MPPVVVMVVVFIALKLAGVIDWSWWWVFSPMLANLALNAVVWSGYNAYESIMGRRDRAATRDRMMRNRARRKSGR